MSGAFVAQGFPRGRALGSLVGGWALLAALALPGAAQAQILQQNLWTTNGTVRAIATSAGVVYLAGSFTEVGPVTGSAVAIDSGTGATVQPYPMVTGTVDAVAADGSGGWYLGGQFTTVRGQPRNNLAHLDSSGVVTSWDPNPNGTVFALMVNGGTVYVGGDFTSIGGQARNYIAAVDGTTAAASSWNPNADNRVQSFTLSEFGTVYAGGDFTSIGGQPRARIAALDATSGAATGWNPGANSTVTCLAVRALQQFPFTITVYAGGSFTNIGGQARNNLAAIDGASGVAMSWNPNPNSEVVALTYSASIHGAVTVYVGGAFTNIGGQPRTGIAALDANGVATSWNANSNSTVNAVAFSGGIVYVGGFFTSIGGQARSFIAALDGSGAATTWNPHANNVVSALAVGGTRFYAGGSFTTVGGQTRHYIAALDSTSGAATSWNPNPDGFVDALAVSGGTVYAGGEFTNIGGQPRVAIAALDPATGAATSWNPNPSGFGGAQVLSLATSRLDHFPFTAIVYAGGYFSSIGGQPRNNIASLDATTGSATSWDPGVDNFLALWENAGIVYLSYAYIDQFNQIQYGLAALNASGNLIWNQLPNGYVNVLAASGATLYVGGAFTTIGNQVRGYVAALDGTTGLATNWNPSANFGGTVSALAVRGSTVYAGGVFTSIGGQARSHLAALDASTGAATIWNPGADNTVTSLAADGDNLYVGGNFSSILGTLHPIFAGISQPLLAVEPPAAGSLMNQLSVAPNPFRVEAALHFALSEPKQVDVAVFDLSGRLVRRLHHGMLLTGNQRMVWDGRTDTGLAVGAGLYFVRVQAPGLSLNAKVLRLR